MLGGKPLALLPRSEIEKLLGEMAGDAKRTREEEFRIRYAMAHPDAEPTPRPITVTSRPPSPFVKGKG